MKKVALIFFSLILIINITFMYPVRTHAIGVVGSSALKQAVVGSWEKVGVTFTNKQAKEKAFDRWQMSTYNKWKADEASGKNADLWAHYNAIVQGQVAPYTKNPVSNMPGVSRMLVDTTIFGLAITVGAEIGYDIQNAQLNQTFLDNLASSPPQDLTGVDLINMTNYYTEPSTNGSWYQMLLKYKDSPTNHFIAASLVAGEPRIIITGVRAMKDRYAIDLAYTARSYDGKPNNGTTTIYNFDMANVIKRDPATGGYRYTNLPSINDVPHFPSGQPHHVSTQPWPEVAQVLPEPVEVLVPSDDGMWDGVLNTPFDDTFPLPPEGTDPDKDPDGKDPDDGTPSKDKNKQELEDESKKLGNLVTTRFPFSLPWDFMAMMKLLYAEPMTPKWEIKGTEKIPLNFTIDLKFLDPYIGWFRGFVLAGFVMSVIFMHGRFMGGSK